MKDTASPNAKRVEISFSRGLHKPPVCLVQNRPFLSFSHSDVARPEPVLANDRVL
jgi:hypothetical protein